MDQKHQKLFDRINLPEPRIVDSETTGYSSGHLNVESSNHPSAQVPRTDPTVASSTEDAPSGQGQQSNLMPKQQSLSHHKTTASTSAKTEPPVSEGVRSMVSMMDNTLGLSFEELREATDNFSPHRILGRGGYGVVYMATLKHSTVAVKRISCPSKTAQNNPGSNQVSEEEKGRWRQSLMELRISALYRHDNILPLYGHSFDGPEPCLVYQYMPMGSLEDRLLCKKIWGQEQKSFPLSWPQRMNIMVGASRGLNFLHTVSKEPLIHGDVKSGNILLDSYLEPKLGDFGLSRRGQVEVPKGAPPLIASHIKGTLAYLPPEFIRSKHLSSKLDVYSFGVVLFEVATGFRAYSDRRSPENLVDYIFSVCDDRSKLHSLADAKALPVIGGISDLFFAVGIRCCQRDPQNRLSSGEVLARLERKGTLEK